ncbi:MAG: YbbR-like domain-containing protein [Deltaproteobacteria bacterium]|nr:YbbR-like domain-containing protein [Deltaproteobacteria bacterium]
MRRAAAYVRALFIRDGGLKFLSLALAVLLWIFVVGEKRSEMTVSIPLELTGVPDDLVILNRVPDTVRARLSGPRTLLAGINPQQLSVVLGLEGAQPGVTTFENLASRMRLPKRIEVTYLSPSAIALELDLKGVKRVAVRPRLRGRPAQGMEVVGVRVDPAEVELVGGMSMLKRIDEVPTETVDVTGLDGSVSRPVELALPSPTLRRTTKAPEILHIVVRQAGSRR